MPNRLAHAMYVHCTPVQSCRMYREANTIDNSNVEEELPSIQSDTKLCCATESGVSTQLCRSVSALKVILLSGCDFNLYSHSLQQIECHGDTLW